jgi:hypothetical protein
MLATFEMLATLATLTSLTTLANPWLACAAQPLAELFLSRTPTNVLRVEASNLHREHKRLKNLMQGGCSSERMVTQSWLPGVRMYCDWTRESW